uniref:Group II intron, maturase-specific domain n=1 Tax=Candidatus Kentrum sp. UNK TaxID=2126344 RepID=A0A451B053_9GAMM|nr:MAG: Group II intron, maturase-specific domain [Candidatus Kentron sp. UNK]VFK71649.1 MAG: Group II intron, maturase-specific domain [Candidatus Kentron sp. UNK]
MLWITEGYFIQSSDKSLDDLTRMFNAVIHGWIDYYSIGDGRPDGFVP